MGNGYYNHLKACKRKATKKRKAELQHAHEQRDE